jgi:copper homeostasis protein (lipoprotein)
MKFQILFSAMLAISFFACSSKKNINEDLSNGDNSRTSVDWAGVYRGAMPCANCATIKTKITLLSDMTYTMETQYVGKSEHINTMSGKFVWDKSGSNITLDVQGEDNTYHQYKVGENVLFKLDNQGNKKSSTTQNLYTLTKVDFDDDVREKYWKLTEMNGQEIKMLDGQSREAHFILKNDDNIVQGHGGCNRFFGTYELADGNRIKFIQLASTKMACENLETENEMMKMLEMVDNYNLNGDHLYLNKAKMAPLAKFECVYFK